MRPALLLCCLALPLHAQGMAPKPSDVLLDESAMQSEVIGQTHEFFDGGRSFFSISGTYTYTYPDGGIAYGRWEWPADRSEGVICTFFRHGFERCDRYVRSNGRLLLITQKGERFPVRDKPDD